jgi:hypothetical protein
MAKREPWNNTGMPTASSMDADVMFVIIKVNDNEEDAGGTKKKASVPVVVTLLSAFLGGGGGGSSIQQTTIDFGSVPVRNKSFTIPLLGCLPTSKIIVMEGPTDEWEMDPAIFIPVPGTNEFICNVAIQTPIGIVCTRTINYLKS